MLNQPPCEGQKVRDDPVYLERINLNSDIQAQVWLTHSASLHWHLFPISCPTRYKG